ncbi:MAG: BON domain-containing protein [Nitrospirae bacterium]|nr:MAG: BON domain-containing protein [Nitrospirota bacterium]
MLTRNNLFPLFHTLGLLVCLVMLTGFGAYYDRVDDDQLLSAIKQRLQMDTRINADRIVVRVKNGHVTLSGVVDTITEKALAEGLVANSIVGVRSVVNNITVRPAVVEDDAIQKQVEDNLHNTPSLYGQTVSVSVRDGIVKLEGIVESPLQRRAAETAARTVKGVKSITNLIKVKPSRPDRDIEKEVAFYLLWSPIVDIDQVDFEVKDGVVTLTGQVEHHAHILTLEQDLEKIEGVVEVDVSRLKVQPRKSRAMATQS